MKTVGVYEAKTKLSALLDLVSAGETITITRHGVAVAVLMPVRDESPLTPRQAAERIRQLRKGKSLGGLSIESLKTEGRR